MMQEQVHDIYKDWGSKAKGARREGEGAVTRRG